MAGPVLVRCDGAQVPSDIGREVRGRAPLEVRSQGPLAKLTLRVQPISEALRGTVADRADDLYRMAAYAYWVDQMVSRGGKADIFGDQWRREFVMCVPVSDPDLWNDKEVQSLLQDCLGFASEDRWEFHFSKTHFEHQLYLSTDAEAVRHYPDSVILFSSGTDGLCAAVAAVLEGKLKPVLVSHHPAPLTDRRQQSLIEHLRRLLPQWYFPRVSILVNKAKAQAREASQRTRSFLFASLGAGIADALAIQDVILADNGWVSINPPINDQLLGALASRSTHPKFIWLFNRLASRVLPSRPVLRNPFWNRTRAEALGVLQRARVPELLQESNSCSRTRLPTVTPHCGTCLQCIDRRFATVGAGMDEHDLAERYRTDIFRDALAGDDLTLAESYVRFARMVRGLPDEALFEEYPQLNDCIVPDDPRPDLTAQELATMVKRHATQVLALMEEQVAKASSALVQHSLPATCLVQVAVMREEAPALAVVPRIQLSKGEEREFERCRFKARLVVQVTGETEARRSNVIRIDEAQVLLPDSLFRLFAPATNRPI